MKIFLIVILALSLVLPYALGVEVFKYDPKNKRDPFIPLVDKGGNLLPEIRPVTEVVEFNLEGIVWSAYGDSYAIINGAVLRDGEIIGDYKVERVERSKVILRKDGEEEVLNLGSEEE